MTAPVGQRSSNPYAPSPSDTCSADPTVSPSDAPPTSEPLLSPAAPQDPAVAPLMDKYRPDVNAPLTAWDTPELTEWEAAAPDSSFTYDSSSPQTPDATSSTREPQAPPSHTRPVTAGLPDISAGTPPVSERHHAFSSDLVSVDKFGRLEDGPGPNTVTHRLTPEAAEAFRRLREYAERDGINVEDRFLIGSAFRNDSHQAALNASDPQALANGFRAKAGNSTHRTGNALDIKIAEGSAQHNTSSSARNQLHQDPASHWLEANAGKFGFAIMGVTRNNDGSVTHQPFWEPWHITYNPVTGAQLPPSLQSEPKP